MTNYLLVRILGFALVVAGVLYLVESRDHFRDQAKAEASAHQQTIANYRAAAAQATIADALNKAKVEASQRIVTERTAHEYEARIADARAKYERLRAQTGTPQRGPNSAPVSGVPKGAPGAPGASDADGFSLSERLTATEQAIQLDQLIRWVNDQAKAAP